VRALTSGDYVLAVSTLAKEEKMKERIEERKIIVHKVAFDLEAAKNIVENDITRFFAKLGFFKPKHEDIECESVQLFYEPFMVAKANYFLDYYKKKTYTIKIDEDVSEVIAFGQTFKPEAVKEGILRRPYKAVAFDAQERIIYRAATHMGLNRIGREIDPTRLPSGPTESEPEEALRKDSDRVGDLKISSDIILDKIRKRTAKRPPDAGRIIEEAFEVTEYVLVCTPIYEARCRQLKTGEIKIIPISGVTGKTLPLRAHIGKGFVDTLEKTEDQKESKLLTCQYCRAPVPPHSNFCASCGKKL
jgi:hypothetical protein